MRRSTFWASAATTALAVGLLSACSDSAEENSADACEDWDTYTAAVDSLVSTLTSEPTVGEVQDARDAVGDAYEDLEGSLEDVAEDRTDTLDEAWETLDAAVEDVDDDATMPEAAASISDQAEAVQAARDDVTAELGCS